MPSDKEVAVARLPRFILPGHPQHIIIRGNNREAIFYAEEDYQFYISKLRDACKKHDCALHAYVLMTNHVHLLITPSSDNGISKAIQMLGRYYVQYFNYSYKRTGTLWEGRYKASLIDSTRYLLTCYRYIELNPVRAGMVDHPSEYPWSSYSFNALGQTDYLTVPHAEYLSLGRTESGRQQAYRGLFNKQLNEKTLDEIRSATNKAWVLGSEYFKEQIAEKLNRAVSPEKCGGDRCSENYLRERNSSNRV